MTINVTTKFILSSQELLLLNYYYHSAVAHMQIERLIAISISEFTINPQHSGASTEIMTNYWMNTAAKRYFNKNNDLKLKQVHHM